MDRMLVLGSNSFGASRLIDDLLSKEFRVMGVSRSKLPNFAFAPYRNSPNIEKFRFFQLDINNDFETFISTIRNFEPNVIVDFAGQGMVAESWLDPVTWYQTNVVSKVAMYKELTSLKSLEKYIRISTPEVYGSSDTPISNHSALNPSTPYALSHATIDQHLMLIQSQFDFPVVIGRFANFYGAGQQLFRIIPKTFIKFMCKNKIELHGGGLSKRSFIHAADVSNGIQAIIERGNIGDVYHFSSPQIFSIKEVVQKIAEISEIPFEDYVINVKDRPGKDYKYQMDTSSSRSSLGWEPLIDFNQGLREVQQWIAANKDDFAKAALEYIYVK